MIGLPIRSPRTRRFGLDLTVNVDSLPSISGFAVSVVRVYRDCFNVRDSSQAGMARDDYWAGLVVANFNERKIFVDKMSRHVDWY